MKYILESSEDILNFIDDDNIEYAVFKNNNGKYCVRQRDMDSGEVVTIRICNSKSQAISIFNQHP